MPAVQVGMGNSQIRFTENFNFFKILKGLTTLWEGSNILTL